MKHRHYEQHTKSAQYSDRGYTLSGDRIHEGEHKRTIVKTQCHRNVKKPRMSQDSQVQISKERLYSSGLGFLSATGTPNHRIPDLNEL